MMAYQIIFVCPGRQLKRRAQFLLKNVPCESVEFFCNDAIMKRAEYQVSTLGTRSMLCNSLHDKKKVLERVELFLKFF